VTPEEALNVAQGAARLRRVQLTLHSRQRVSERGVFPEDLESAIKTAKSAQWDTEHNNWKLSGGVDLDGDALEIALDINGTTVKVVTVF
jgi:hypothetical protein